MSQEPVTSQRFSSLIGVVARQWRRALDRRLQPFDLTEAMWRPLVQLARQTSPMLQKDLAESLLLDRSTMVRIVGNLEAAGLIERVDDGGDRRAKPLVVTERGRHVARQVEAVAAAIEAELLGDFDPADVASARRVLHRLSAILDDSGEGA
jgi:MarR family transcriptional regulator, transcriptional regulator for hemolysin